MPREIARRLIGNVWRTVVADEASANGGSLPDEWTVADNGGLTVNGSDSPVIMSTKVASDPSASVECSVIDNGATTDAAVSAVGFGGSASTQLYASNGSAEGTSVAINGEGWIALFTKAGKRALELWDDVGNTLLGGTTVTGAPMIGVTAAPADGDLAAGQVSLWFDDTDGAAKLMIKGKSANGTVVVGEVPLT